MPTSLTEFLLARIAEDERLVEVPDWYCTDSARGEGWGSRGEECPTCGRYMFDGTEDATDNAWNEHMAEAHGRMLAECKAKRRIVEDLSGYCWEGKRGETGVPCGSCDRIGCRNLRALASTYADHPGFDPAWRP